MQKDEALEKFASASAIFIEIGDHLNLMKTMMANAELAFQLNQFDLVIEIVPKAIELAIDVNDPLSIIKANLLLGKAFLKKDDFQQAIEKMNYASEGAKSLGLAYLVFSSLRALAVAYQKWGKPHKADEVAREHQAAATHVSDSTDDAKKGEYLIAELCELRGEFSTAIEFYEFELAEARKNNDLESELVIFRNLATCYKEQGDQPKLVEAFTSLVSVAKKLNHPFLENLQQHLLEIEDE